MGQRTENTTGADVALAYEAFVSLGAAPELEADIARMKASFQKRTGSFGPEDPWFEPRVRAFWDDTLASQGLAELAAGRVSPGRLDPADLAAALARSHRGFFLTEEVDEAGALLVDVWSGAELLVTHLDDTQTLTLEHAEGAIDGRIVALGTKLFLLPGAYHHPADTLEPAIDVLTEAKDRGLATQAALDALLRMELTFRASSRVKAAFAYRVQSLPSSSS